MGNLQILLVPEDKYETALAKAGPNDVVLKRADKLFTTGESHIRRELEWHQRECEGILLLIAWYLIPEDITVLGFEVPNGLCKVVYVQIAGFQGRFEIWEKPYHPENRVMQIRYASNFDFSICVDTRPTWTADEFYMVV